MTQGSAALSLLGGGLLFLLVLALAWLCARWMGGRWAASGRGGHVEVLDRTPLGPDRSLVVVRAGGKVWLLGVTAHHVDRIGELDPERFPPEDRPPGGQASTAFSAALRSALGRRKPENERGKGSQDE